MRYATDETYRALKELTYRGNSLRAIARSLTGKDNRAPETIHALSIMSDVLSTKPMSPRREDTLRVLMGLPKLPAEKSVVVCSKCSAGEVHHCECDGSGGLATWIPENHRITAKPGHGPRPRRRCTIEVTPEVFEAHAAIKGNRTWSQYLASMLGGSYVDEAD